MRPELLGGLPPALLQIAQTEWFPDVVAEVARHRAGLPPAAAPAAPVQPGPKAAPESGKTPGDGNDSLLGDDQPAGGDLLSAQPQGDDSLDGTPAESGSLDSDADSLAEPGGSATDDSLLGPSAATGELSSAPADSAPAATTPTPVSNEDWVAAGGWYRRGGTLYYRPGGHADPFMTAWLDLSARVDPAAPIFELLAQPKGPGLCVKCHSVEVVDGIKRVHWRGRHPEVTASGATIFDHGPHLSQVGKAGCGSCHRLDPDADYAHNYEAAAAPPASNFYQLHKAACVGCHAKKAVGDDCQLCHRYHVAGVSTPIPATGW
jgi:hypothetical protein